MDNYGNRANTCTSGTDEYNPDIYINEFYPCKEGAPSTKEFIELKRFPHKADKPQAILHHKVVAFTAKSRDLLLVINIHRSTVNNFGLLLLADNEASNVQTPKKKDFYLVPCSTKEPVVLLLLERKNIPQNIWAQIALTGPKDTAKNLSPRRLARLDNPDKTDLFDVFTKTVIDGYIYGKTLNSPIKDDIKELLRINENNCNFILSTGNPNKQQDKATSLNSCPDNIPVHFDAQHVKLGIPTPGSPNDCSSRSTYQFEALEQPRSSENLVGVTVYADDTLECIIDSPNEIEQLDALINYEIEYIRKNYDQNFASKFYPVTDFSDKIWPQLKKKGFDSRQPDFPETTPFEIVRKSESIQIPYLGDHWRCEPCSKRLQRCPHSMHQVSKLDEFSSDHGRQIPTKTAKVSRYLNAHTKRQTHYTSVLYSVREDRRLKDANARKRYREQEDPAFRRLANVFLDSFTLIKTSTAIYGTETWYKTLRKLNADVGPGPMSHGRKAATNIIIFYVRRRFF